MSLSSFVSQINISSQLRGILGPLPECKFGDAPVVPPRSSRQSLIGTAFDYLLRIEIERRFPLAKRRPWVAQAIRFPGFRSNLSAQVKVQATSILDSLDPVLEKHRTTGLVEKQTLQAVLRLAQLDHLVRSDARPREFGTVYLSDMRELSAMLDIVPWDDLAPKRECVLNPTFGRASTAIGGADADLFVDQCLLEIKTTAQPTLDPNYLLQLVGYYALASLGGIDGCAAADIRWLGVYSARYGRLFRLEADALLPESTRRSVLQLFSQALGLRAP